MWTIAAPALAASMQDWAIWAGETGTAGLRLGESAEPVSAQEIMILRCIRRGFLIARTTPAPKAWRQGGLHFAPARCQKADADASGANSSPPSEIWSHRSNPRLSCHPWCTALSHDAPVLGATLRCREGKLGPTTPAAGDATGFRFWSGVRWRRTDGRTFAELSAVGCFY